MTIFIAMSLALAQSIFLTVMAVGEGDPLLYLLNLGVAGLGLLLFVRGQLHSSSEINVYKEQNAKLWETNQLLMQATNGSAIPALLKSTEVVRESTRRGGGLDTEQLQLLVNRLEQLAGNEDHR